jgi:hypothetical protein
VSYYTNNNDIEIFDGVIFNENGEIVVGNGVIYLNTSPSSTKKLEYQITVKQAQNVI